MKAPNFFLVIIALIIGTALVKEFDFQNNKFDNLALAIIYIIVFAFCIVFIIKNLVGSNNKQNQESD